MKPKINETSDINIAVGVGKIKIEYNCLLQKKKKTERDYGMHSAC
jgi:hypothetical protein